MLKTGNDKLIVGFDLGNLNSQISYCFLNQTREIHTLSDQTNKEVYSIPTVLCKRMGINQWFFGREALTFKENNPSESILIENLVINALQGEEIFIEGQGYDPVALLTLYVKKCMSMLGKVAGIDKVVALMITTENLSAEFIAVLEKVVHGISLNYTRVYFQSYAESFYYFALYQSEETRERENELFFCDGKKVTAMQLAFNYRTTPIVAHVREEDLPVEFPLEDEGFARAANRFCGPRLISAIYLIGAEFAGDWMQLSLKYLCRGRKVFQGVNLFSKGACYSLLEKQYGSEQGRKYVFLGNDKLKSNIGMKILRQGKESYLALLNAGENWYEEENTVEIYIENDSYLDFVVTPLIGGQQQNLRMELPGLFPEEQRNEIEKGGNGKLRRVKVHLYMVHEKRLVVEVTDLGFGEFFPATGLSWTDEILV